MKPLVVEGKVPAYVYAKSVDEQTMQQIRILADTFLFRDKIVIMPDCHGGRGAVIGFTGYFNDVVVPNVVGVDIGCGVYAYKLSFKGEVDLKGLDKFIKANIPTGLTSRSEKSARKLPLSKQDKELLSEIESVIQGTYGVSLSVKPVYQLATLGSGNHFIELGKDDEGNLYLSVHTGSRNLGLKVCNHFQRLAKSYTKERFPEIPASLAFLPLRGEGRKYLRAMRLAQSYADLNRRLILKIIVEGFFKEDFNERSLIESVHNYIDLDRDMCVRKGAISAHKGQRVIIPLNLVKGSVIGVGVGNEKLNFSAPHGAGRKLPRKRAKRELSVSDFAKQVKEAGVYSSTISKDTLDEAPAAYKDPDEIIEFLPQVIKIEKFIKPIYNLKG